MFDIGFWELGMIGVVALLVIGPERLPKVAKLAGFWFGKTRSYIATIKQELESEMELEELKKSMAEENPLEDVKELTESLSEGMKEATDSISKAKEGLDELKGKKKTEQKEEDGYE